MTPEVHRCSFSVSLKIFSGDKCLLSFLVLSGFVFYLFMAMAIERAGAERLWKAGLFEDILQTVIVPVNMTICGPQKALSCVSR